MTNDQRPMTNDQHPTTSHRSPTTSDQDTLTRDERPATSERQRSLLVPRSSFLVRLFLTTLLLLLSACADGTARPTVEPLQLAEPAERRAPPRPTTTAVVQGDSLPGRLLFVQNGVIWLWQGREGRPFMGDGMAWQPAWGPDGAQFAYVERGPSYSDIVLADASGQLIERLTANGSDKPPTSHGRIYESRWAFYPSWSPDGARIALSSQFSPPTGSPAVEYNLSLYTMPANGGTQRQVYADESAHCGKSTYARDGVAIVYTRASTEHDGQQQLHRLDLTNGLHGPFPGAPPQSYDPAFSPDGIWLAFAVRDGDRTDIAVLPGSPAAGSEPTPQRLTSLGTARAPAFSPDGKMLAFLAIPEGKTGFELWVADLNVDPKGALSLRSPRQITSDLRLDANSGISWAL